MVAGRMSGYQCYRLRMFTPAWKWGIHSDNTWNNVLVVKEPSIEEEKLMEANASMDVRLAKFKNLGYPWSDVQVEKKQLLEEMFENFINRIDARMEEQDKRLEEHNIILHNREAQLRNIVMQLGKLAKTVAEEALHDNSVPITVKEDREVHEVQNSYEIVRETGHGTEMEETPVQTRKIQLPCLEEFQEHESDRQTTQSLDIFSELHIDNPFLQASTQMPNLDKFLKGMKVLHKTEEGSIVVQTKFPRKVFDPGIFGSPCHAVNKGDGRHRTPYVTKNHLV